MKKLKHLTLPVEHIDAEIFSSSGRGGKSNIPVRNKLLHANNLKSQIEHIKNISTDSLICSIKFKGQEGKELLFQNLDMSSIGMELLSVKEINGAIQANVRINPETSLDQIIKKIESYATSPKDNSMPYIASIEVIEKTELEDFFTDDASLFPREDSKIWWEVYVSNEPYNTAIIIREFRNKIEEISTIEISTKELVFEDRIIFKCSATKQELNSLLSVCGSIAEIRIAKTLNVQILEMTSNDSNDLLQNLLENITYTEDVNTRVVVMDGDLIIKHPLIESALLRNQVAMEHFSPSRNGHATEMASLSLFGDITDLLCKLPYNLQHKVENVQIFDDVGMQKELWGFITEQALEKTKENKNSVYVMAVTETNGDKHYGKPSTWSGSIDALIYKYNKNILISVGNLDSYNELNEPLNVEDAKDIQKKSCVESPAQSWNSLSVGAYTTMANGDMCRPNFPFSQPGDISPHSKTSGSFTKQWPLKPEVLFEGGNKEIDSDSKVKGSMAFNLVSCSPEYRTSNFIEMNATSASTALAGKFIAELMCEYPDFWPETIRGLSIHSAEWTDMMKSYLSPNATKTQITDLSKRFGYGVPNINKAQYSASNSLTLIAEKEFQVYSQKIVDGGVEVYKVGAKKGTIKHKKVSQILFFDLPWPTDVLGGELGDNKVKLKITLSYFIQPNPSERGYTSKYNYQSHNLRFDIKRPTETLEQFKKRINKAIESEEENQNNIQLDGLDWYYGSRSIMRTKGSVHKDILEVTGAELASMKTIAVYSVGGWWKNKTHIPASETKSRFSLIVDVETPDTTVDLYTEIKNIIEIPIKITI